MLDLKFYIYYCLLYAGTS
uniref:Uncharacterized protein n=1 Tax=Arundo donax TaxID=35708 RepID=A0A0A9BR02_ARUDO